VDYFQWSESTNHHSSWNLRHAHSLGELQEPSKPENILTFPAQSSEVADEALDSSEFMDTSIGL
jgi:hypothetical protein